jgi:hypothetical protein
MMLLALKSGFMKAEEVELWEHYAHTHARKIEKWCKNASRALGRAEVC